MRSRLKGTQIQYRERKGRDVLLIVIRQMAECENCSNVTKSLLFLCVRVCVLGGCRPWYSADMPRDVTMELLERSASGAFIIRDSNSQPGNLAMSMRSGGNTHHFVIRRVPGGGWVLGSEDERQEPCGDLAALVTKYSKIPGCLPRTLRYNFGCGCACGCIAVSL